MLCLSYIVVMVQRAKCTMSTIYTGLKHKEIKKASKQNYSPLSVVSQDKPAFREVISQLEMDPKCKGLPFSSFLILPFQRITRLKLLVQVQHLYLAFTHGSSHSELA